MKLTWSIIAQVETLLTTQGPETNAPESMPSFSESTHPSLLSQPSFGDPNAPVDFTMNPDDGISNLLPHPGSYDNMADPSMNPISFDANLGGGEFSWEMIGLGIDEPLPPPEVIDEL